MRTLIALCLALVPTLAFGQASTIVNFRGGSGLATEVSPSHPLPVSTNSTASKTLTVTASSAYTAGDSVGGLQTYSSVSVNGGFLQAISIFGPDASTSEIDAFVFNANPSASTCTDKTAFALAAADAGKLVAGTPAQVTNSVAAGTPTVRTANNLAIPFAATTLYVCYVTRGTPTFSSTTGPVVQLGLVLN